MNSLECAVTFKLGVIPTARRVMRLWRRMLPLKGQYSAYAYSDVFV